MASGDTITRFTPLHSEPHASSPATLDTRNSHPVIDFDAALNEYARFSDVMPAHYGGGGLTVYTHTAFSTATSGSSVWAIGFERIGGVLDIDADSFAAAACVTVGAHATAGIPALCALAFANGGEIDSIAVGEGYRLQIQRVPADASDTATGDAELRFVEIQES